jgi:hypothetical protein
MSVGYTDGALVAMHDVVFQIRYPSMQLHWQVSRYFTAIVESVSQSLSSTHRCIVGIWVGAVVGATLVGMLVGKLLGASVGEADGTTVATQILGSNTSVMYPSIHEHTHTPD